MTLELLIPVPRELSLEELLTAIEADQEKAQEAYQKAIADALPLGVCAVYRRQEERLRTARDVIRFYLETAEEAVNVDIDTPLPIEATPSGQAICAVGLI